MYRYSNNAFRILGLKPDASLPEIKKRVNEIKVKTSLGQDIRYEYDFPFLGPINREEENILNALQRLEDPITRLKEEIFWFWIETEDDKEAIDCLIEGNRAEALYIWNKQLKYKITNERAMFACINQIILVHGTTIAEEIKIQNRGHLNINNKHWDNWQAITNSFILINENDLFWEFVEKKADRIADPRLSQARINEIRTNFLADVFYPNFLFISQALNKNEYHLIEPQVALLCNSFLRQDLKMPTKVLKEGFNKILSYHTDMLNECASNTKIEFNKIENNNKGVDELVESILSLYHKFVRDIENIIFEGNLVDIENISDFALVKDKVAEIIRIMSISLFNSLIRNYSTQGRKDMLYMSYIMIKKAMEYSATNYSLQKIMKDRDVMETPLKYIFGNDKFVDI